MKKIKSFKEIPSDEEIIISIGNYDGVHLAHVEVLSALVANAKDSGSKSVVITFTPHPKQVFSPDKFKYLTEYKLRSKLLHSLEIDYLVEVPFTRDFSTMSPEDFLKDYIFSHQRVKKIFLGHDFSFGSNKSGDKSFLEEYISKNNLEIEVSSSPSFKFDEQIISSSMIRNLLHLGKTIEASKYLGRLFTLNGIILKGDGRGKKIGFPTANITTDKNQLIPKPGVYASKVDVSGMVYNSITNVGFKPTFKDQSEINIETHIFDFDRDIYGEGLIIYFLDYIRDEVKFSSVNDLVIQIQKDVSSAKNIHKSYL